MSEQYSCYIQRYSTEQVAWLLKHKSWDHHIPLCDLNTKIPTGAIYRTTWEEDAGLGKCVQENIPTGKVQHSCFAAAVPILFVLKKVGSLRLCVDYRALHRLTMLNKFLLPLLSKLLNKTRGRQSFTRLHLNNVYNLIRIAVDDKCKTAIHTKQGLFEYIVMPFGLTNTHASC